MNYWDTQASDFGVLSLGDSDWQRVHEYQLQLLSERLPDEGRVLEVGGGVGRLLVPLASENPDVEFVNLDSSEGMLREFESRSAHLKNLTSTSRVVSKFDFVYCVLVIQHNDPDSLRLLMSEITGCLKPDGHVLVQFVRGDQFCAHGPRSFDYTEEQIRAFLPGATFFKDESDYADSWWWAEI